MKSATGLLSDGHFQKLVLENVSNIIVTTDLAFVVQSWNHVAEQLYGHSASKAIGQPMYKLVSFTFYNTSQQDALLQLQSEKQWQGEVSFTAPSGEIYYFSQCVKYVVDEAGTEVGIMAVGTNITDRKKAEEKLAESEKFYRTLIADSLDATLLMNEEGVITFASPAIKTLLGFTAQEVLNTNGFGYIHPDDIAWTRESFNREVEENPEIKFVLIRLRKKGGDWLWCMARGHNLLNIPHIGAMVIYLHDDTPRKQATDALRESEKRFRTLIRDLRIGVLLQDAQGNIIMTNNAMVAMFELPEEEVLGGKIWELYTDVIHEDGGVFKRNERPSFKALQTRKLVHDVVMGVWHAGRKERVWIMVSADPVLDAAGEVLNVICSFTDITERKKLEKKSIARKIAHQRQLTQATIDGQEKERLEIGCELHDNIGQQLTSIKLFLDVAKTAAPSETATMMAMALKSIANVIDDVRMMSRSLVPPSLKDLGFIDSVNDLLESLRTTQAIKFQLEYRHFTEDQLPENKKLALFRIVQEQLNNIVKYAAARTVCITLCCIKGQMQLTIKDDGKGFDLGKVRRGLGLTNIINRTELFGGQVEIITSPGTGCTVKVCLPQNTAISCF